MRSRAKAEPGGFWTVRYATVEAPELVSDESYLTKAQARERFFVLRARKTGPENFLRPTFVELRNPDGQLWFRDKFFGEAPHGKSPAS